MAYNNFYPVTYPQYQMPQQNAPQAQIQAQNGIIWCQGIEGAKAHFVPAGGTALLMDSDGNYMYIKSADQSGMPTLKTFKYEEITELPKEEEKKETIDFDNYITRDEFEKVLEELRKPLVTTKSTKKKEGKDE